MTAPHTVPTRGRRAAVGFILVSVALDVLSMGVVIPVFPKLIQQFEHGDAAAAGRLIGIMTAAWAIAQFVGSPIMGALSDRFGRRPVMLTSLFGLGLDYILLGFAPSVAWLFIGRVISGFTAASNSVASAYIADVTPPEQRAARFGLIGATWGLGFIIGPSVGGLLGDVHIRLPFLLAAGVTLVGAIYGLFVLPESLAPENRAPFSWGKANPLSSLGFLGSHPELLRLSLVNVLMQFAHAVLPTLFILYTANRYDWSLKMTGSMLAMVGVGTVIVQAVLVPRLVPRLGELGALVAGLACGGVGLAVYGLAPTGGVFLLGIPVFVLLGLYGPGYQGMITRRVDASEQGRLQGANGAVVGLTGIVAPIAYGMIYAWSVTPGGPQVPGAAFLVAAVLLGLGALIALPLGARSARPAEGPAG